MVHLWGIVTDFKECDMLDHNPCPGAEDTQLVSIHGTFTASGNASLYFGEKEGER